MSIEFEDKDLLQIAIELEETSRRFYETLAEHAGVLFVRQLCSFLAKEETQHEKLFARAREMLAAGEAERLWAGDEYTLLNQLSERMVLADPDRAIEMVAQGNIRELVDLAIQLEKDSLKFYAELHLAAGEGGAAILTGIIEEERRHVEKLTAALQRLP